MQKILVATDFSERSDRAMRRAALLAKASGAAISLVHVVDDDQPQRMVQVESAAAESVLEEKAQSLRAHDGLPCDWRIVLGDPFAGIVQAVEDAAADLVIVGPHRRSILKDVFVGTTAERTVRSSKRPVLMANGVPAGAYRHALIAVDLSPHSAAAVQAARGLRLAQLGTTSVLHVFDAPATGLMRRTSSAEDQIDEYHESVRAQAVAELSAFLQPLDFRPARQIVHYSDLSPAHAILTTAREVGADLIVLGIQARSGIARLLLGSVAEETLRNSNLDVLVVPSAATG